jgi:hypothetical protein
MGYTTLFLAVFLLVFVACQDPVKQQIDETNRAIEDNLKLMEQIQIDTLSKDHQPTDYSFHPEDTLDRSKDELVNELIEMVEEK